MKKIVLIALPLFLFFACKKAEEQKYDSRDNIYLDLYGSNRDSILYTFAYTPEIQADTLGIPVRIAGLRTDTSAGTEDREFILKAELDSSTAVPGKHFKALESVYHIKKGTGYTEVPLIIYNTDPLLQEQSVTLHFRLYSSKDFGVNIPKLVFGKLVLSSKLERPGFWGMWFGDYYSRTKHEIFLITTGKRELSTEGLDAPMNLYFVSLVNSFLADPARWVEKNPAKGYVLEADGSGRYYFYNVANPTKKMLYRLNEQANKYYFIDENGKEVI
ncbi:MAG: DUF4843 domain-containing protein [Candidatus Pseudobacter hemicellulosilyticus]|uniref:DUF4843 domain-containing protein n=1 Tax=Candidatus Pseudobacter hemicellulosilyticus TaxID=3121375 RepID=A0AAJ5WTX0_9BACT|nr:MAG: DUF4843 domain-containing protein [Pseudobacter sp.]